MELVEALKNFGLSNYEARALIALISKGVLSAKEIAEISGIPRTSVYDVMNSLISKGLVEAFGKPTKFKCLSSDEIISVLSRRVNENLEYIKKELPRFTTEVDVIKVYRNELMMEKLKEIVSEAKNEILAVLSYTSEEMGKILSMAKCKVVLISSNASSYKFTECYDFKKNEEILKWTLETGALHGVFLVDDRIVYAIFVGKNMQVGILSEGKGILEYTKFIVEPMINFVKLKL